MASTQETSVSESKQIYESFPEFMRAVVLPMHIASPGDVQLDGQTATGNWDVAGRFRFRDRVWNVHMDSRYEPLILAYYGWLFVKDDEAFVETATEEDRGRRLDVADELRAINPVVYRHLYIYEDRG